MSANHALVFDLSVERDRRATMPQRISLADALRRIERSSQWLGSAQLRVLAFSANTLHDPVIIVASHPRVWSLFSGRAERTGYRQDGALRYEVWEGIDHINHVCIRWLEVMACAA